MRLKNKKTGETYEGWLADLALEKHYGSLAELNAEWCDAPEEPKEYWYINPEGEVTSMDEEYEDEEDTKATKEIGNYFLSREKAEKAVERLRAWKRLKDKGFRVNGWTIPEEPKTPHIKLIIEAEMDVPDSPYDLDICFGGEE